LNVAQSNMNHETVDLVDGVLLLLQGRLPVLQKILGIPGGVEEGKAGQEAIGVGSWIVVLGTHIRISTSKPQKTGFLQCVIAQLIVVELGRVPVVDDGDPLIQDHVKIFQLWVLTVVLYNPGLPIILGHHLPQFRGHWVALSKEIPEPLQIRIPKVADKRPFVEHVLKTVFVGKVETHDELTKLVAHSLVRKVVCKVFQFSHRHPFGAERYPVVGIVQCRVMEGRRWGCWPAAVVVFVVGFSVNQAWLDRLSFGSGGKVKSCE